MRVPHFDTCVYNIKNTTFIKAYKKLFKFDYFFKKPIIIVKKIQYINKTYIKCLTYIPTFPIFVLIQEIIRQYIAEYLKLTD